MFVYETELPEWENLQVPRGRFEQLQDALLDACQPPDVREGGTS